MAVTKEAWTGPKIGSRVSVRSVEGKELGLGTYMGQVPMEEAPDEPAACVALEETAQLIETETAEVNAMVEQLIEDDATTPKIVLDSGETVYGFQCWWSEVDDGTSTVPN